MIPGSGSRWTSPIGNEADRPDSGLHSYICVNL